MKRYSALLVFSVFFHSCVEEPERSAVDIHVPDTPINVTSDTLIYDDSAAFRVHTGSVTPEEIVAFAHTLKGVPYNYGCSSPDVGFDCSGFITYVFDHFNIVVPRSSVDFTNIGKTVEIADAKPGDLILFTGTNSSIRRVGHMGIVIYNANDSLSFIHSSSGSANSVTITPLNEGYKKRFVKITRVFPQNERS